MSNFIEMSFEFKNHDSNILHPRLSYSNITLQHAQLLIINIHYKQKFKDYVKRVDLDDIEFLYINIANLLILFVLVETLEPI